MLVGCKIIQHSLSKKQCFLQKSGISALIGARKINPKKGKSVEFNSTNGGPISQKMHKYLVGLKGQNGYLLFQPVEGARVELVGWESGRARKGREMLMNGRGERKAPSHLCRPVEKKGFYPKSIRFIKISQKYGCADTGAMSYRPQKPLHCFLNSQISEGKKWEQGQKAGKSTASTICVVLRKQEIIKVQL